MNISQILENLGENRADFVEALADASHYLWQAIDLLDPKDQVTLRSLLGARDAIDEVLGGCEALSDDSDADDGAGDKALQEAYDIIATDDIDPTDTEQLATELMRGWH